MTPQDYHALLQQQISDCPLVIFVNVSLRQISSSECYFKGQLDLHGGFRLSFAEYVIVQLRSGSPQSGPDVQRLKYRYQLMDSQGTQIARWDNAPHHPQLAKA